MSFFNQRLRRRDALKLSAAGVLSGVSVPWFESLASAASIKRPGGKSCILLWMDGGPSQQHTFDPKPGGEFKSISTTVPGIQIVEQLPKLSTCMEELAILRSMRTEINDHYDAKYYLHTGYKRTSAFEHPAIGCMASSQIGREDDDIPSFITIDAGFDKGNGGRLYRSVPAYLGPQHAPLAVHDPYKGLENLQQRSDDFEQRLALLARSEERFAKEYPTAQAVGAKQAAFQRAVRLMHSKRAKAFNLDEEPPALREAYGPHKFGQSCLLARRLIEAGVSFVEVFHRGWDDHEGAAKRINERAPWMDAGMATLITDLKQRGLLEDTLVVWMGEFGRSPGDGGGHFCQAWSTVWAGGGINSGLVVGKTTEGKNAGSAVADRPISAPDYVATLCAVLGIDPHREFLAPGQRPMSLVDKTAKPISELLP